MPHDRLTRSNVTRHALARERAARNECERIHSTRCIHSANVFNAALRASRDRAASLSARWYRRDSCHARHPSHTLATPSARLTPRHARTSLLSVVIAACSGSVVGAVAVVAAGVEAGDAGVTSPARRTGRVIARSADTTVDQSYLLARCASDLPEREKRSASAPRAAADASFRSRSDPPRPRFASAAVRMRTAVR